MNKNHFESNQRYFTICIYMVFVIFIACIIFRVLFHWDTVVAMIKNFLSSFSGFIAGILLAFIVSPLVNFIYEKIISAFFHFKSKKVKKIVSIILAYVIVLGVLTVCLVYIIPQFVSSIIELSKNLPAMYDAFSKWLWKLFEELSFLDYAWIDIFMDNISIRIMEFSTVMASEFIPWLYEMSMAIIQWFITIVIAIVVSIYLLSDKKLIFYTIKKIAYAFCKEERVNQMIAIVKHCNQIFSGYIIAQALDASIVGVLCFLFMSFLGLPYAIFISVIVAVTNMIPYFGPYIGAVPAICILAAIKIKYGIMFAVMIFLLQQLDGWILAPRILGNSTGLRPLVILFSITFGGAYLGILGLFLGVPIAAVLQYLCNLWIDRKLKNKNISTNNWMIDEEE